MIRSMSTDDNEDDISLLDLAITIRQNLGLLLIAPAVAGGLALGGRDRKSVV